MSSCFSTICRRYSTFGTNALWRTCVAGAVLPLLLVCSRAASAAEPLDDTLSGAPAAPLGWSSAVADFDADGVPDSASAESVQNHAGGGYRLNIRLSGGAVQRLTIAADQGAIDVTAVDVDNDRDLDIVVRPILSNDVIGIWLNDGAGQFTRGSSETPVLPRATLRTASVTSGIPMLVVGTISRVRWSHPVTRGPTPVAPDSARLIVRESSAPLASTSSSRTPPRAPPVLSVSFI